MDETQDRGSGTLSRADRYCLLGLVILALATRVPGLSTSELWHDEATSVWIAIQSPGGAIEALRNDGNPPLYYLLLHLWTRCFGIGEAAVRFLSVLFGIGLVCLVYVTGRRWFGRIAGSVAAVFVALSPLHVFYSGDTRMYTLLPLISLLAILALERLVRESDWRGGILYAVLLALCLYTHNYSLFLLPVGILFALTYKPGRWRALLLTGGSTATALIFAFPWLPVVMRQARSSVGDWIPGLFYQQIGELGVSLTDLAPLQVAAAAVRSLTVMAPGMIYPAFQSELPFESKLGSAALGIMLLLFLAASLRPVSPISTPELFRRRVSLSALYLLVPIGVPLVYLSLVKPIYLVGRYEIIAFPACALLVGAGVQNLAGSTARRRRAILIGLGLLLAASAAVSLHPRFFPPEERLGFGRYVAREMEHHLSDGDALLFLGYSRARVEYELRNSVGLDQYRLYSFPADAGIHPGGYDIETYRANRQLLDREANTLVRELNAGLAAGSRLWVIDDGNFSDMHAALLRNIESTFGPVEQGLSRIHIHVHRKP